MKKALMISCDVAKVAAALLSAVLCLGAVGLWPRSLFYFDRVQYCTEAGTVYSIWTPPHGLAFGCAQGQRAYENRCFGEEATPIGFGRESRRWGETYAWGIGGSDGVVEVAWHPPENYFASFGWKSEALRVAAAEGLFGMETRPEPVVVGHAFTAYLPDWFLILVLAVMPVWVLPGRVRAAIRTWRLWRSRDGALCVKCGYDLRASEGRCPECGTAIAKTTGRGAMRDPTAAP